MEKFFIQILMDLDKLSGIKQYKKYLEDPNGRQEIADLLRILVRTCKQFPDVPPDAQRRAIRDAVVSDEDFIGLNAKFVSRALNRARERMAQITPKAVDMTNPDNNPNIVTGAARDEWLRKWQEELNKASAAMTAPDYQEQEQKRRINQRRESWGFPKID